MSKTEKKKTGTWWKVLLGVVALLLLCVLGTMYYFLKSPILNKQETQYLYIDRDDNVDSLYQKMDSITKPHGMKGFRFIADAKDLASSLKRGRYALDTSVGAWDFFNILKRGEQTPLNVPIPSARTMDKLAVAVSKKLELDSLDLLRALTDSTVCARYGFTKQTIPAMFIPDSYNMYWTVSVDEFLDRMKKEYDKFWDSDRMAKAKAIGLSPVEVSTLASIVTEETRATQEKPTVAGLYLNRLKKGMLLQSDPTVKFAMQDFGVKRILNRMLTIDNPYNTYKYNGLPPGPIRVPMKEDLEAVLNHETHDYIYMCAKEDFSGTHNYARTEAEHRANAAKYHRALNERGIR